MDENAAFERQFKIDIIIDDYNPIVTWFDKLWNSLVNCNISIYANDMGVVGTIYYSQDTKKWFFYIGDQNDEFDSDIIYCNEKDYYDFICERFHINGEQSYITTKILLGNVLGRDIPHAIPAHPALVIDLESRLL